ncbi:hypothetical protein SAMN04488590_0236 [Microbacterium sp. 77mftsu3.1]|nr:hypothetical protein SAMN04488590_0236 [Microbacterium sp. 77mftsu3.1]
MSVDRSVVLHCDAPPPICRGSFGYGTTNLRTTREAAAAEGWVTGLKPDEPDYCPRHVPVGEGEQ